MCKEHKRTVPCLPSVIRRKNARETLILLLFSISSFTLCPWLFTSHITTIDTSILSLSPSTAVSLLPVSIGGLNGCLCLPVICSCCDRLIVFSVYYDAKVSRSCRSSEVERMPAQRSRLRNTHLSTSHSSMIAIVFFLLLPLWLSDEFLILYTSNNNNNIDSVLQMKYRSKKNNCPCRHQARKGRKGVKERQRATSTNKH